MPYQYQTIAVGGTFDRLHAGHILLLQRCFALSNQVVIGLTVDHFVKQKTQASLITSYNTRKQELIQFLNSNNYQNRYEIIELTDVYGVTVTDARIEALVVTEATVEGASTINQARQKAKLTPLPFDVVDLVYDTSGHTLSSTRIRQGLVDRSGRAYQSIFTTDLQLSPTQSQILKKPMDQLIPNKQVKKKLLELDPAKLAIVGDASTKAALDLGMSPNIICIDGYTQRGESIDLPTLKNHQKIQIKNPAGTISSNAVKKILENIQTKNLQIKVEGEEDLLTLVLLLLLPLDHTIIYGQPNQGIVLLKASETNKNKWRDFLLEG